MGFRKQAKSRSTCCPSIFSASIVSLVHEKLFEKAFEAERRLSPDVEYEITLMMVTLAGNQREPEEIDPAHLAAVLEGLAQAKRGQFATDAEVEAAFRRFEQ